jgi:surfeit locus 1 family protein
MTGTARGAGARLLGPGLLALAAFAVLVGLGVWQIERKSWKEGLIASLTQRLDAPPAALPPASAWPGLDPARDEFRRVKFAAEFPPDTEALAYTPGSALRADVSGPTYWVFAPARLADGNVVVVNRGAVPDDRRDPATRRAGATGGRLEIEGVLRWPEADGLFTPADDPQHNLWFRRDQRTMAAAKGWGEVAPFYVEQEAPPAPGGLPRVGRMRANLPNNHLQYALTWFALAAALAVIFILRARRREPTAGA